MQGRWNVQFNCLSCCDPVGWLVTGMIVRLRDDGTRGALKPAADAVLRMERRVGAGGHDVVFILEQGESWGCSGFLILISHVLIILPEHNTLRRHLVNRDVNSTWCTVSGWHLECPSYSGSGAVVSVELFPKVGQWCCSLCTFRHTTRRQGYAKGGKNKKKRKDKADVKHKAQRPRATFDKVRVETGE